MGSKASLQIDARITSCLIHRPKKVAKESRYLCSVHSLSMHTEVNVSKGTTFRHAISLMASNTESSIPSGATWPAVQRKLPVIPIFNDITSVHERHMPLELIAIVVHGMKFISYSAGM